MVQFVQAVACRLRVERDVSVAKTHVRRQRLGKLGEDPLRPLVRCCCLVSDTAVRLVLRDPVQAGNQRGLVDRLVSECLLVE
jgi:hypothetical protein